MPAHAGLLLSGLGTTASLAAVSSVLAFLIGTGIAVMRISRVPLLRGVGATYVEIVRNAPVTVVFFFVVFVLPELGVKASFYILGVAALTAYTCTYFSEVVRSGVNSVPRGQAEAARALGLTTGQVLLAVVLPQAIRTMIPPLANTVVVVVKSSSIAGVFGVAELMNQADNLTGQDSNTVLQVLGIAALLYLVVTIPIGLIADFAERRLKLLR
jgi:glutamate transport system permease protein